MLKEYTCKIRKTVDVVVVAKTWDGAKKILCANCEKLFNQCECIREVAIEGERAMGGENDSGVRIKRRIV